MGVDCKSTGLRLRWFETTPAHPERRLQKAGITQLVEFHPSKVAVVSSNLIARLYIFAQLAQR